MLDFVQSVMWLVQLKLRLRIVKFMCCGQFTTEAQEDTLRRCISDVSSGGDISKMPLWGPLCLFLLFIKKKKKKKKKKKEIFFFQLQSTNKNREKLLTASTRTS